MKTSKLCAATRTAIAISAGLAAIPGVQQALAQETLLEEVVITGSRITQPGVVSSSPISSISAEQIAYFQEPEVEKILRTLPGTVPGDGGNVNNGTEGAATVDLRGLGPERTLVLMNGKRMTPFNFNGEVDVATIPTALVERIDVVTGGASAVYGSDAIAGAVNFILKRDFEGVEISASHGETGEQDGEIDNLTLTFGSNLADDRGNIVLSFAYYDREPVLLGQRPLGRLGINTADGANLAEFRAGQPPIAPPAGCGGPNVVGTGGSTTAIPTRFALIGAGAFNAQFREDGTIGPECSEFNFNPFNYYQTPMERYSATSFGHFELDEHAEIYGTINYSNTTVVQQVAPSGTFGEPFDLPLANPFIGAQARQYMIDSGNSALAQGLLNPPGVTNWQDINGNGVVDVDDYLQVQLRRRTVELGARSENYDSDQFQLTLGSRGTIVGEWDYDVYFQYGESNRTTTRAGYTNLTNIQNALDSVDGVTCNNGDATCVPINLFGGFGTITEEMVPYAQAIALQQQKYQQTVGNISVNGPIDAIQSPFADSPMVLSIGYETRTEKGALEPDECLKLAPSSCQGGAGGNLLPISGGYKVDDIFMEVYLPLVSDRPYVESLALEAGYRSSAYDITSGREDTWKIGVNWSPAEPLLLRAMKQQAIRAPNVGEIASPVVTGLENAQLDPCSVANLAIDTRLRELCISTGMLAAQVGNVQDVISGQVNVFDGSDPAALPNPETADTFTAGFVWTPQFEFLTHSTLSVDYYDIEVQDVIGEFSAQEILDACYVAGITTACDKINRIAGDLTISGAGIERFTTNLDYIQAEGVEVGFDFGVGLGRYGELQFTGNINKYLTQESQSSSVSRVIDCKGFFGTSCDPLSDLRWIQRTTWLWNNLAVSAQWRHIDSVDVEPVERNLVFSEFQSIDSYDYFDLFASYNYRDIVEFSLGVDNVSDEDPPIVGGEAGDTAFNSGNTFPSSYDTMGRLYTFRVKASF